MIAQSLPIVAAAWQRGTTTLFSSTALNPVPSPLLPPQGEPIDADLGTKMRELAKKKEIPVRACGGCRSAAGY